MALSFAASMRVAGAPRRVVSSPAPLLNQKRVERLLWSSFLPVPSLGFRGPVAVENILLYRDSPQTCLSFPLPLMPWEAPKAPLPPFSHQASAVSLGIHLCPLVPGDTAVSGGPLSLLTTPSAVPTLGASLEPLTEDLFRALSKTPVRIEEPPPSPLGGGGGPLLFRWRPRKSYKQRTMGLASTKSRRRWAASRR